MPTPNELIAKNIGNALTNIKTWGSVSYNVLDEGLKGGGVVDDTDALQNLIDRAIAAGRRTIMFPHGKNGQYFVTHLENADQVDFIGDNSYFVGGYAGIIENLGGISAIDSINTYENVLMRIANNQSVKIGCVGDSTTLGPGNSDAYPAVLGTYLNRLFRMNSGITVVNDGVSGDTCAKIIARLPQIIAADYDLVILSIGINDTSKYINSPPFDPEQYKEELTQILRTLKKNNIGILLLTPLAVAGGNINYVEHATDRACRDTAIKENVHFLDLRKMYYTMLQNQVTTPTAFTVDYVHPRDTNYKYIADIVLSGMFFIPTVKQDNMLPAYASPFSYTNIATYAQDGSMTYIRAVQIVAANTTGYLTFPIFVEDTNLTVEMLANKNSTSGTSISVKVNGVATIVNLNNGTPLLNQSVNITQNLVYGLNWIEVFAADCNGNAEIQAFKIKEKAWTQYTPVATAVAGAITAYTATGWYEKRGNLCHVFVDAIITTNGTAASGINITLPLPQAAGKNPYFVGVEDTVSGVMIRGRVVGSLLTVLKYDNTHPGADGARLRLNGVYELA